LKEVEAIQLAESNQAASITKEELHKRANTESLHAFARKSLWLCISTILLTFLEWIFPRQSERCCKVIIAGISEFGILVCVWMHIKSNCSCNQFKCCQQPNEDDHEIADEQDLKGNRNEHKIVSNLPKTVSGEAVTISRTKSPISSKLEEVATSQ
jgi:hypothetical protein